MTKSQRLKPIVKVAQDKERKAAKELGQSQQVVNQRKKRLEELLSYRDEYTVQFTSARGGNSAFRLNDFRAFIDRLNKVIEEQRKLVDASVRDYEEKKRLWFATRGKAKALDKAVERFRGEEVASENRKEQREIDDRVKEVVGYFADDE